MGQRMNIEVGRRYKTKSGKKVTITHKTDCNVFTGSIEGYLCDFYYDEDGSIDNIMLGSGFDIASYWTVYDHIDELNSKIKGGKMKIEVGKHYQTRTGGLCRIEFETIAGYFAGRLSFKNEFNYYDKNGKSHDGRDYDLVGEVYIAEDANGIPRILPFELSDRFDKLEQWVAKIADKLDNAKRKQAGSEITTDNMDKFERMLNSSEFIWKILNRLENIEGDFTSLADNTSQTLMSFDRKLNQMSETSNIISQDDLDKFERMLDVSDNMSKTLDRLAGVEARVQGVVNTRNGDHINYTARFEALEQRRNPFEIKPTFPRWQGIRWDLSDDYSALVNKDEVKSKTKFTERYVLADPSGQCFTSEYVLDNITDMDCDGDLYDNLKKARFERNNDYKHIYKVKIKCEIERVE